MKKSNESVSICDLPSYKVMPGDRTVPTNDESKNQLRIFDS